VITQIVGLVLVGIIISSFKIWDHVHCAQLNRAFT